MENFDRDNIDELLEIRQIRQYFPPSKICAVRYDKNVILAKPMYIVHTYVSKSDNAMKFIYHYLFPNEIPIAVACIVHHSEIYIKRKRLSHMEIYT